MEHRLRRKRLNSDTNAGNKAYLKEIQEKRKRKRKTLQNIPKKDKRKKGKEGPKRYPEMAQKNVFFLKRNLEAIEAKKKSDFEQPRKEEEKCQ